MMVSGTPPRELLTACAHGTTMEGTQVRTGKELIAATRPFATEDVPRSWWYLVSTFALLAAATAVAALAPWWPLRLVASVLEGLLIVRAFILYHDGLHGALLHGSRLARWIFRLYGVLVLTPPTVWRETHNYHHAHTAKIVGSHIGSYPVLTTEMWRRATPMQRLAYRVARHPLTILLGYVTIFLYGMCVSPFLRNPRKNWDSLLALVLHFVLSWALWHFFGAQVYLFALLLPLTLACALGAYLFYAQHNFPGIELQPRESWSYTRAALESSSFMAMGPIMAWFTGNIGYHHVHHLNPSIPFYRLPEAMAAIPELQHPRVTTLRPRDIIACFRLDLWDPVARKMVTFKEVSEASRVQPAASPSH